MTTRTGNALSLMCALTLLPTASLLLATPAAAFLSIEWLVVGDPGNTCDSQSQGCFGAVANAFRIGKYEVTNTEYVEFLNAVADADPNELYIVEMSGGTGGIDRSGSAGSYTYSTIAGRESMPASNVSFWNAARFANWLHNGQPTGAQSSATTEGGAYTLTSTGMTNNTIVRNPGAKVFVPSEDEWYKAAYYDTGLNTYYDHPAGADAATVCSLPNVGPNRANCSFFVMDLTPVGTYSGSPSPNGTFDQGGNLDEWNEAIINISERGLRGSSYAHPYRLAASDRFSLTPETEFVHIGFRVASVAPAVPALGPYAALALAALFGLVAARRLLSTRSLGG